MTRRASRRAAKPATSPAGEKNYVTPRGLRLLREELDQLRKVERPKVVEVVSWAAGNGDRSENGDYIYGKKRLREIDRRLRYLLKRIENAEPVDPARQNRAKVFFGATVTFVAADADLDAPEERLRIVGVDEALSTKGTVSWRAPIARALMKAEAGDLVTVRTPEGAKEIEVISIAYEETS
ncbi:MAG TPA: transcription elongation factor GreB [Kiloniellaceae bacterium]|nr:transcription elongation factor GreB [Kiloniellaceae bacterium]